MDNLTLEAKVKSKKKLNKDNYKDLNVLDYESDDEGEDTSTDMEDVAPDRLYQQKRLWKKGGGHVHK